MITNNKIWLTKVNMLERQGTNANNPKDADSIILAHCSLWHPKDSRWITAQMGGLVPKSICLSVYPLIGCRWDTACHSRCLNEDPHVHTPSMALFNGALAWGGVPMPPQTTDSTIQTPLAHGVICKKRKKWSQSGPFSEMMNLVGD